MHLNLPFAHHFGDNVIKIWKNNRHATVLIVAERVDNRTSNKSICFDNLILREHSKNYTKILSLRSCQLKKKKYKFPDFEFRKTGIKEKNDKVVSTLISGHSMSICNFNLNILWPNWRDVVSDSKQLIVSITYLRLLCRPLGDGKRIEGEVSGRDK